MPVSFTLPLFEQKPSTVKDMVFTILTTKYPLSLIELLNTIKRQYNISISFQSVRKAVLELVNSKVLIKEDKKFSINQGWILEMIKFGNFLQKQYFTKSESNDITKIEVGQNVTIYTIPRLIDMDNIWASIISNKITNIKENEPKVIAFASVHFWWVIVNLAQETELMKNMNEQGIKSYFACYGNKPLDKWIVNYYKDIKISSKSIKKPNDFINGHNIGVYGNLIIQATHPKETADKINKFFEKYKRIEDIKPAEIMSIVTENINIKMTVIEDHLLAKTTRESILKKFK